MAEITESSLRKSISAILKGADLNSCTSKKVRKQLEEEYDTDFTDRKKEIDNILMEMIAACQNEQDKNSDDDGDNDEEASGNSGASSENEQSDSESDEDNEASDKSEKSSESDDSDKPPPKKKSKTLKSSPQKSKKKAKNSSQSNDSELDDEALARQLQEEEIRSRSRAVKKSSGNKKESKSSRSSGGGAPKQKKENSYTRKCLLSPALAEVVGSDKMARHDVVKTMWSVVRERNLFDPSNKQFAICDEQLHKVFGTKRIRLFGMMKYLKNHMTDLKP